MKLSTDAVLLGIFAAVNQSRSILDVGTGSGIIALILAQRSDAEITGIDIDKGSLVDACANFDNSRWSDRLSVVETSIQEYSVTCSRHFDHIVTNPPYFVNSLASPYQSRNISKHTHQLSYEDLLLASKKMLVPTGLFSLILPVQESEIFQKIAHGSGLFLHRKMMVYPKESRTANRVLMEFQFTETSVLKTESLVIRNEDNSYTEAYKEFTRAFYLNLK